MRKFVLILLGVVVVLIGVALIVPFVVPTETYKRQIARQVESVTGRNLTISGPLTFTILPQLAFEAEDVALANPPGASSPQMITLEAIQVNLKLWPLVQGTLAVDRFILVEPQIALEVDREGHPNWRLGEPAAERPEQPPERSQDQPQDQPTTGGEASSGLPITEIKLGDIRIENGSLTYTDARDGTAEQLSAIDMSLQLPDLQSPLQADGSLDYKGQTITLALTVDQPAALLKGDASPVKVDVTTPPAQLGFDGQLSNGAEPAASGKVDLDVSSIRDLAAWLVEPLAFEGEGLQTLRIAGQLDGTPQRIAFTDATIGLDAIEATGQFVADVSGAVPKLDGRLDLGAVDLDPYLPPASEQEPGDQGAGEDSSGWSDEPIQVPPIGGADVDFALSLESLTMRGIELGRTVAELKLAGQTLTAVLKEMALYGGQGSGQLDVTVTDGVPAIRQQFRLAGLQALPFLEAVAGLDRLEGTADVEIDLTSRGSSELQLVQNLDGNGSVTFTDGAIVGINIAAMVRNTANAFLDPEAGEQRKTDFGKLSGTFTIQDGILINDDMHLQAPVLRVDGHGRVDLPARTLAYLIEPKAAATLEGQGGDKQVAGVLVPVAIQGPWDDLTYQPDLSGVLESALQSPEALKKQLEQLGESPEQIEEALKELQSKGGVQDVLEGLTGAATGQDKPAAGEGEEASPEPKAGDAAQKLLEGLFGK